MERVGAMHKTVMSQRANIPPLTNEAMMTRRVMDAIEGIRKKKTGTWTLLQRPIVALRYSMAVLSVLMISFFIGEYSADRHVKVVKMNRRVAGSHVELNLASFHGAFLSARKNNRENAGPISECVTKCLQAEKPDCQDCSDKFAKP